MTISCPRLLRYSLAASLLAAGFITSVGTAANADTHPGSPGLVGGTTSDAAHAAALAQKVIKNLMIGQHQSMEQAGPSVSGVNGLTQVHSNNWAGYADTGTGFSKVSASWTEPSASCGSDYQSLAAFWVGLDGLKSSSVEQDGTLIECYLGTEYQYTWWEMYPSNSVQTVGTTVSPGDHITSSVVRVGTRYTLKVTDSTHPRNSFSTTQTCSSGCDNSSAEWVAEAPSGSSGTYPLTNFGSWTPYNASVRKGHTSGTVSSFSDEEITMTGSGGLLGGGGSTLAQPGNLNSSGDSFNVNWEASS